MKVLLSVLFLCFAVAVNAAGIGRIFGGSDAPDGKYPYQVSFQTDGYHWCGGSIISKRWILTAAHCAQGTSIKTLEIHVGSNKLTGGQVYKADYITYHKEFSIDVLSHDIGLIRVNKDIKFNEKVQPIALPTEDLAKANTPAVLTGWGSTKIRGDPSNNLQQLKLKIISQKRCEDIWNKNYTITESHICTMTKVGEGACIGDSGGPLVVDKVQVGIDSFGDRPCAKGKPDVFTRVFTFLDWIKEEQKKAPKGRKTRTQRHD